MNRRSYAVEVVAQMLPVAARHNAEGIIDRLNDEGLLHLGYGDADIDRVIEKFKDTFGTTKVSKHDRWAANRLVKAHNAQSIVGIIDLIAQSSGQKYAPVVNNISELEDKWVSILNFVRKQKGSEEIQL